MTGAISGSFSIARAPGLPQGRIRTAALPAIVFAVVPVLALGCDAPRALQNGWVSG
jgi:hypothetical protein